MSKYDTLNDKLIELVKSNHVPWRRPWRVLEPINPVTGTAYSGRNWLVLNAAPYNSPYFLTYNQAKAAGGTVKRGESGWPIVWYGHGKDKEGKDMPVLAGYTVFNAEQCEGIGFTTFETSKEFNAIEDAERIVAGYKIEIQHTGNKARYKLGDHYILMPERSRFDSEEKYYYTLFHELIHSTGPALNRVMIPDKKTKAYAFEELIAEIGASYLAKHAHLVVDPESTAAYLQSWIPIKEWTALLQGDKTFFIRASSQAQKAVNFILGVNEKEEVNVETA